MNGVIIRENPALRYWSFTYPNNQSSQQRRRPSADEVIIDPWVDHLMCRSNNQSSSSDGMRLAATAAARPGGGRAACVCYSGLLRGFSDGAVAENHIAFMLEPMRRELLFREIDVLFSLSGAENIPAPILERYAAAATLTHKESMASSPSAKVATAVAKAKGGPRKWPSCSKSSQRRVSTSACSSHARTSSTST